MFDHVHFSSAGRRVGRRLFGRAALTVAVAITGLTTTATPAQATVTTTTPVVIVHGFDGGNIATGDVPLDSAAKCNDPALLSLRNRLRNNGFTEIYIVGYYKGDTGCSFYVPGRTDNTIDTSIAEIGRELGSALRSRFGARNIAVIGHSMGGLIARSMLAQDELAAVRTLRVSDAVTAGSAHLGAPPAAFCGLGVGPLQCQQMAPNSSFLANLTANPQATGGTEWTLLGSDCDTTVPGSSAVGMPRNGANRPAVLTARYRVPSLLAGGCMASTGFEHIELISEAVPGNRIVAALLTVGR